MFFLSRVDEDSLYGMQFIIYKLGFFGQGFWLLACGFWEGFWDACLRAMRMRRMHSNLSFIRSELIEIGWVVKI